MLYEVGTRIDLSYINKPKFEAHLDAKKTKRSLYSVGTKILFVDWIPTIKTYTIVPSM